MMKKNMMFLISLLIFGVCTVGCSRINDDSTKISFVFPVKMAIFSVATLDDTYLINISDKSMEVIKGERKEFSVNTTNSDIFNKIADSKEVALSSIDVENIKSIFDKINFDAEQKTYKDGWNVVLTVNGEIINLNYNGNENEKLRKLISTLVQISPIKIDIHSIS